MTYEDFYGKEYKKLKESRNVLEMIAEEIKTQGETDEDVQQVVYYCSRIKKPESMIKKLEEHGLPINAVSAVSGVYDAVGIRIICSFASDVYSVVEELEDYPAIEILKKKDYLSHPKPNGYRSIHLIVRIKENEMPAEIQVRTIAMDFWATLEHQIKYKKNVNNDRLIKNELKRCADEIASTDLSMQTIREILKEVQVL